MAVNLVSKIDDRVFIRNVIVSVYDKQGLDTLVLALLDANPECTFFATGGSFDGLKTMLGAKRRDRLVSLADFTGQPEMQGGLVKTLDFKIYLALLAETYNKAHQADLAARAGGTVFDMVISNLYPFRDVSAGKDATAEAARANIDIGGPCLVRAAAKNFHRVAAVTDKADYPRLADLIKSARGALDLETRYTLARKAFLLIADYDRAIAEYLMNTGTEAVKRCYTIEKKGG